MRSIFMCRESRRSPTYDAYPRSRRFVFSSKLPHRVCGSYGQTWILYINIISYYSADQGPDHIPHHTQGVILVGILMIIETNQGLPKLNLSLNLEAPAKARNRG